MRSAPVAFALVASACARYTPAPLGPGDTAAAYQSRRLDTAELRAYLAAHGAAPADGWRSSDLALVALYYQPALDRARAQWRSARAGERTAAARPQPDLQGELGYAPGAQALESRWLAAINAVFTVELGGKRGARLAAARARTAAAVADLEETAWRVTRVVRAGAVQLAAAEERLADAELGAERTGAFAARLRQRYAEGALARSDLAAIETEDADARAALLRERALVAAARDGLAQAAGLPPAALAGHPIAPEAAPSCAADATDSLQTVALHRRPDLGRALAGYAIAEAELRLAVAGAYADLSLGPGYTWDQGIGRWSLVLALPRLPLNGNRGPIAEATARRREEAARFAERQQGLLEAVAASAAACRVALAELAGADSLRRATARRAELARAAYDRGEIGASELEPIELADARVLRELHAARRRLAEAGMAQEMAIGAWPPGEIRWPDPRQAPRPEGVSP
ncbi:MAG TPA: TolC family protein [Gemmatimonadales bacterium]|nr:TolC family protein [Gemmatimonadales bacterium]